MPQQSPISSTRSDLCLREDRGPMSETAEQLHISRLSRLRHADSGERSDKSGQPRMLRDVSDKLPLSWPEARQLRLVNDEHPAKLSSLMEGQQGTLSNLTQPVVSSLEQPGSSGGSDVRPVQPQASKTSREVNEDRQEASNSCDGYEVSAMILGHGPNHRSNDSWSWTQPPLKLTCGQPLIQR